MRLAKRFNVPYKNFSYAGRKDRHALTTQLITIEDSLDRSFQDAAYSLEALGFTDEPMTPEFITGNRFEITVRSLAPGVETGIQKNLEEVAAAGLVNYFDDQRFGSYDRERGFMAGHLLRGDMETALRIYLTLQYPGEKKPARERKRRLDELWGDWRAARKIAGSNVERRVLEKLEREPRNFAAALNLLPREELSMALSALQSHVWNLAAAKYIVELAPETLVAPGKAAPYRFHKLLAPDLLERLRGLNLPTPGPGFACADRDAARHMESALADMDLAGRRLEVPALREAYIKSARRDFLLIPRDLELVRLGADELYQGRRSLTLRFALPRGCFGTMLIKRLMIGRRKSTIVA